MKNVALNTLRRPLILVQELEQGKVLPCLTSAGKMGGRDPVFATLCMSVNDHPSAMAIDLGATHFSEEVNSYPYITRIDCFVILLINREVWGQDFGE